jgi:hypothetical protein
MSVRKRYISESEGLIKMHKEALLKQMFYLAELQEIH